MKILFAIHKLWKHENVCLKNMNYENRKISAIYELWKNENVCLQYSNMKTGNYLFAKHELKNRKMFTIHYENICLQYMNYENVCNTWIMKIGKYLFAIHELWKMEMCLQTWIMKIQNICL